MVPIPDPKLGPRKVDVASMYNTERYRPEVRQQARPAHLPDAALVISGFLQLGAWGE